MTPSTIVMESTDEEPTVEDAALAGPVPIPAA
jgi:hypothetical protein